MQTTSHTASQRFPQFIELNDDLMMNVLSFLSDVPMELDPHKANPRSSVTGCLNLVCKRWHAFCQSDYVWKSALQRLLIQEPYLWRYGLINQAISSPGFQNPDHPQHNDGNGNDHDSSDSSGDGGGDNGDNSDVSSGALLDSILRHSSDDIQTYLDLYKSVFENHIRMTAPVFYMTGAVRIGEPIGLHFFEPRYRLLIAEVMRDFPDYQNGQPIVVNNTNRGRFLFPTFYYAHMSPLAPTTPASIVQVRQCMIRVDGTADVVLLPVGYVWFERVWERPNSGHLYYGRGIRMGAEATRSLEQEQQQQQYHQWLFQQRRSGHLEEDLVRVLGVGGTVNAEAIEQVLLHMFNEGEGDDDDNGGEEEGG